MKSVGKTIFGALAQSNISTLDFYGTAFPFFKNYVICIYPFLYTQLLAIRR